MNKAEVLLEIDIPYNIKMSFTREETRLIYPFLCGVTRVGLE